MEQELKVGSVVYNSWGYDQTNVDFYQVVRKTAKSAWVKKLPKKIEQRDGYSSMAGYASPDGEPIGGELGPFRINKWGYIAVNKYGGTGLWDGQPKYCSWYA